VLPNPAIGAAAICLVHQGRKGRVARLRRWWGWGRCRFSERSHSATNPAEGRGWASPSQLTVQFRGCVSVSCGDRIELRTIYCFPLTKRPWIPCVAFERCRPNTSRRLDVNSRHSRFAIPVSVPYAQSTPNFGCSCGSKKSYSEATRAIRSKRYKNWSLNRRTHPV